MSNSFHCARFYVILGWLLLTLLAQPAAALPTSQNGPVTHTVQPNETLSEIAETYDLSLANLMAVNGIENPDAITVGQELRLPGINPLPAVSAPEPPLAAPSASPPIDAAELSAYSLNRRYAVQFGDTLSQIAARYDVTQEALRTLNRLDDPGASQLRAGQILVLPATASELAVHTEETLHTVTAGESLGQIAEAYGVDIATLQQRNRIPDPNALFIGQELRIPAQVVTGETPQIGPPTSRFYYHPVQPGETLSEIARTFNSTVSALMTYNSLPDQMTVYAGLDLRIPYGPPQVVQRVPPTPRSGTRFMVSVSRQQCWLFRGDALIHSWNCSTGQGEWVTRTGTFPIKTRMEVAQSSAYRLDMPYWLGLYDVNEFENGIHGIPTLWSTGEKLWDALIGQPATFGCAMLMDDNAAELYEISYLGMPVHIVE